MTLSLFITLGFIGWFSWMYVEHRAGLEREMGRFNAEQGDFYISVNRRLNSLLESLGGRRKKKASIGYQASKAERDMTKKLQAAGLESAIEQGRFILIRIVCAVGGPTLGALGYLYIPAYYATILTLMTSAAGILVPIFWLKNKILNRNEEIQRELPLVLDLVNLGTSAGWDVAASFERVIDALFEEFPEHPLIKELKRARWLTSSGYTWNEALIRVSQRMANDSVRRTTLSVGQAIKQGGDRRKQLEGIAEDAQRIYYSELDKRLAQLPVKSILITMLLMVAYFIILLAPAAVKVKNILFT